MFNNEDLENEFTEEHDELEQIMKSNEIKGVYHDVVDQLVRANFKNIEVNGIDIERMKLINLNNTQLIDTLEFMLSWFVETEEYEKCTILQKYLTDLKEA
jgi:hypothetical protein